MSAYDPKMENSNNNPLMAHVLSPLEFRISLSGDYVAIGVGATGPDNSVIARPKTCKLVT